MPNGTLRGVRGRGNYLNFPPYSIIKIFIDDSKQNYKIFLQKNRKIGAVKKPMR